jgi:plastocyanin
VSSKSRVLALVGAGLASMALATMGVGSAFADSGRLHIEMTDDCDPATFNAPPPAGVGPGTCRGDGDTTFAAFIAELTATKVAEDWVFDPSRETVRSNQKVVADNVGGEAHTFSCVTAFGGGVVPPLNQLSGNNTPAVPCGGQTLGQSFGATLVPSGGHLTVNLGTTQQASPGVFKFQCLIHPWMRSTLRVGGH